jgi:hypothetical protein
MKGGDSKSFGEEAGTLVLFVSHSERLIDRGLMETDEVGSNNVELQNHLKKRRGGT